MRQIYVIALFFLPILSFSQLYIQPKGEQESYVYVEDKLFYVEKHIHLQKNPGPIASLYLRNEAQLLQGPGNFPNTGNGSLSVFQEGKASAYTYNYWSAPVDVPHNNSRFGEIFYEPLSRLQSSQAIITNDLNGTANPLKISRKWIYKLEGTKYDDWQYAGDVFDVKPGEGFTMKGVEGVNRAVEIYGVYNNPGNEQRYDFRGKPNNGQIVLQVRKEEVKLVGNPYPSALDLDAFLLNNNNFTGIAYFWDSGMISSHYLVDYEGGYGAYSPSVGSNGYVPAVFYKYDSNGNPIENTGNTGYHYSRRYSPIGQGFVVEGLENGPIYFRNEYREYQKEDLRTSQFKSALGNAKTSEIIPSLRFNVQFNGLYTRQLLLAFSTSSTNGVDRAMDARNLTPLPTDAGWLLDYEEYLINVKPFDENEEISLFFSISETSTVNLSIAERENFDRQVYLFDKLENKYYNLRNEISLILEKGDYEDRFVLTFIRSQPLPEDFIRTEEIAIFQNNNEKQLEIITSTASPAHLITLFDITGQKVAQLEGNPQQLKYSLSTARFSNGYYIVKIKSVDGAVISKKVIISN